MGRRLVRGLGPPRRVDGLHVLPRLCSRCMVTPRSAP
jgi:hypothetical protein